MNVFFSLYKAFSTVSWEFLNNNWACLINQASEIYVCKQPFFHIHNIAHSIRQWCVQFLRYKDF